MRSVIVMTPIVLLLGAGAASAHSGQGGYLGEGAVKDLPSVRQDPVKPPPERGSGEGGYLGSVPGSNTTPGENPAASSR